MFKKIEREFRQQRSFFEYNEQNKALEDLLRQAKRKIREEITAMHELTSAIKNIRLRINHYGVPNLPFVFISSLFNRNF